MNPRARAWAEIDPGAITQNVRATCAAVGREVRLLAVVKAYGYGHGAVEAAQTSLSGGAHALGIATVDEAAELRSAGIKAPILLLGAVLPEDAPEIVAHEIEPFLYDLELAQALSDSAVRLGKAARVHVKVDCGMGRLGLAPQQVAPFLETTAKLPSFHVAGMATQLPSPETSREETLGQLEAFDRTLAQCRPIMSQMDPAPIVHTANSATCVLYPESRYDMVRVGLLAYGINPLDELEPNVAVRARAHAAAAAAKEVGGAGSTVAVQLAERDSLGAATADLRPAMAVRARLVSRKRLPAGSKISYGGTYTLPQDTFVGVVSMGYADGFSRHLSNRGEVLVRGVRVPVIGVVCMDLFMVDLARVPSASVSDVVTIIGRDGANEITPNEIAARTGVPVHTVVSCIGSRVPRVYKAASGADASG